MNIGQVLQTTPSPDWRVIALENFIVPIVVAVITYLLVNGLGERNKRIMYSRLGIAIIESLQEEIGTGIDLMTRFLNKANGDELSSPLKELLPNKSWSGMSTIPDEVLLRIIQTSAKDKFTGFHPRQCRIHCKNYFEHICQNYKKMQENAWGLYTVAGDWRPEVRAQLGDNDGKYIQAARGVQKMLEVAKRLLEANTTRVFPK